MTSTPFGSSGREDYFNRDQFNEVKKRYDSTANDPAARSSLKKEVQAKAKEYKSIRNAPAQRTGTTTPRSTPKTKSGSVTSTPTKKPAPKAAAPKAAAPRAAAPRAAAPKKPAPKKK